MLAGAATLTVVGSGTLVPSATRRSPAYLIETPTHKVLMDCGPGTVHGLASLGVPWEHLSHVGVTHFHNDHVGDLPALMTAFRHGTTRPRSAPLTLFGPTGFRSFVEGLLATASATLDQAFPVVVHELEDQEVWTLDPAAVGPGPDRPDRLRVASTPHTAESVAYRFSGAWGSIGYTGDTGPSDGVARSMTGVDVLLAECTHGDDTQVDGHLTPSSVAALAGAARPRLLVVIHVFPPLDPDDVVRAVSGSFEGRVLAGRDGLRVRVAHDAVTVDPPESGV